MKCKKCSGERKEYRASMCFDCWCDAVGEIVEQSPICGPNYIKELKQEPEATIKWWTIGVLVLFLPIISLFIDIIRMEWF